MYGAPAEPNEAAIAVPVTTAILKFPTVVELPENAKGENVTPLTVACGTAVPPTLNAPTSVPAVLTSVFPEMFVAEPQVITEASDVHTPYTPTATRQTAAFNPTCSLTITPLGLNINNAESIP